MNEPTKTCFVIQPFDGMKYDKRYDEVFKPAIIAAGLSPIRADEVLGTRPIIETIEEQISQCDTTLVEITESNENVFLELGYALAMNKPCVIVCDREVRKLLPFDIRHRPVVFYDSHSPSSFTLLGRRITNNLKEEIGKDSRITKSNVKTIEGEITIEDYENSVIGILLIESHDFPEGVPIYPISRSFARLNYTDTTLSVALESLKEKAFIIEVSIYDEQNDVKVLGYRLTDEGMKYVLDNRQVFASKKPVDDIEEDVPF